MLKRLNHKKKSLKRIICRIFVFFTMVGTPISFTQDLSISNTELIENLTHEFYYQQLQQLMDVHQSSGLTDLSYSTFIGGSEIETGWSIAIDSSGCAYITGDTYGSNFPTTPGAFNETHNGNYDIFVSKLSADGSTLIYSTFIGGHGYDRGNSIAVDSTGCAYIAGETSSMAHFPTTPGAYNETYNGGFYDAFVLKLSSDGSSLHYSTLIGGSDNDIAYSIAIEDDGTAIITGETMSNDFPTTPGAFNRSYSGGGEYGGDLFVCKLSPDGSSLLYSTFIGGDEREIGW